MPSSTYNRRIELPLSAVAEHIYDGTGSAATSTRLLESDILSLSYSDGMLVGSSAFNLRPLATLSQPSAVSVSGVLTLLNSEVDWHPPVITHLAGVGSYSAPALLTLTSTKAPDYQSASTLTSGSIAAGATVTGTIDTAGDVDWFKITLNAGATYVIKLLGAQSAKGTLADPSFGGVYDSAGHLIAGTANDDYGSSSESRISFTPTASATYYLAAAGYDATVGTYTLAVSAPVTNADLAASSATSASIAVGATLRSTIDRAGDVDWIKATLNAGQTYAIELNADGTTNRLADPLFKGVYTSAGALIAGTDNDDYGIGANSRVTFTPGSSGIYYLAAAGYGENTGAYALRLLSTSTPADSAGQTAASALALTVGTAKSGSIDYARDVDWYKVSLAAGQNYTIKVRGADSGAGSLADPELIGVYNGDGVVIAGTGNDDSASTRDARTLFQPATSGDYYVALHAADDGTGSYKVSVETAAASNDLAANPTTSATLVAGTPLASAIDTPGDVDWVKVALTAGTTYQFDLRGADTGDGSLSDPTIVGVFSAAGLALSGSSDDDSGTGANARVTLTAARSETCFVAVAGYGDDSGSYRLALTASAADTSAPALLSLAPADGTQGVLPGSNLTLNFNEAVRAGSGNITLSGGGLTRTIAVGDTAQVSFSGASMTINPSADLAADTSYTVTFPAGTVRDLAGNAFAGVTSTTQFNFHTAAAGAADSWTIMVYMAGDNNLEGAAIGDINEMEAVSLPASVNVVALLDRAPGYDSSNGDWTGTRSGAIRHDSNLSTIGSTLSSLGELDTGAGATLTNFINASVASNPASHYALIVWDHGGGLSGTAWDDSSGGDNLTLAEMREAVDASVVSKFDFIGFDACLQGMLEQATDLRALTDVVVASQELEPGDGWEYNEFLAKLVQNPNLTSYDLANAVVDSYGTRYAGEDSTTLAAVRTGALGALNKALDGFTGAAIAAGSGVITQLLAAAERSTAIDKGEEDYRDLGDFMHQVGSVATNAALKAAAAAVTDALQQAVLSHTGTVAGANGLSIYLPLESIGNNYASQDFQFLQAGTWGNFLRFMLNDTHNDLLQGDASNNDLRGFGGNDSLLGGAGADLLDGGAGADSMTGGSGADTYYVDNSNDRVIEAGSGGLDQVNSYRGAYTLADNVENGRILASGAANLTGNNLDNVLYAGTGANTLDGGTGNDTVSYAYGVTGSSGVTASLAGGTASGGSGADFLRAIENLSGSANPDALTGNAGVNVLTGAGGRDSLTGGAGNDTFVYQALSDSGISSATRDVISDFMLGDKIDLSALDADTAASGNQAFSAPVVGGTFSNVFANAGDLYFDNLAHILYGNVNANPAADFAIELSGVTTLAATDLIA